MVDAQEESGEEVVGGELITAYRVIADRCGYSGRSRNTAEELQRRAPRCITYPFETQAKQSECGCANGWSCSPVCCGSSATSVRVRASYPYYFRQARDSPSSDISGSLADALTHLFCCQWRLTTKVTPIDAWEQHARGGQVVKRAEGPCGEREHYAARHDCFGGRWACEEEVYGGSEGREGEVAG